MARHGGAMGRSGPLALEAASPVSSPAEGGLEVLCRSHRSRHMFAGSFATGAWGSVRRLRSPTRHHRPRLGPAPSFR